MATRTSRRGAKEHTPVVTPPHSEQSSSRIRPPSPLSPTRMSRIGEKKQMQQLNNRLAGYIERVRSQNNQIDNLESKITTIEETKNSEITSVKYKYDKELNYTRKALDDVARERAKLQIEAEKFERENREIKQDLTQKEKQHDASEKQLKNLQVKYNTLSTDVDDLKKELYQLKPENVKLQKKLEDAKRNLESETILRIEAQNLLQTNQEGLKFDNDILQTQLNESRRMKTIEISELDGKYKDEYDYKLKEHLEAMRSSYDSLLEQNRSEISRKYDADLEKYKRLYAEAKGNSAGHAQELREMQTKVAGLTSRNSELEASNAALSQRMNELLRQMEDAAAAHRNEMVRKDAEIRAKDEEMDAMLKDYNALMEIKVALDMEIAAYQKMLEGEEARLGLSQTESPEVISHPGRGAKRKRLMHDEEETTYEMVTELKGNTRVVIEPLDESGKFVRIQNKTDDDLNIGGWKISCIVGENEEDAANGMEMVYKFHRSITLASGTNTTIYSADVIGVDHSPPHSLVMKNKSWATGKYVVTTLLNKEDEIESIRITKRLEQIASSRREGYGDLYHRADEQGKCNVM